MGEMRNAGEGEGGEGPPEAMSVGVSREGGRSASWKSRSRLPCPSRLLSLSCPISDHVLLAFHRHGYLRGYGEGIVRRVSEE